MPKPKLATGKTTAKRRTAVAKAVTVTVKIDAKLESAWATVAARLEEARSRESAGFDAYWESASAAIEHDPPLYLAGGYETATQFITGHLHEKERTARRNMRVARYASPAEIAEHGPTKLDAALSYLEAGGNYFGSGRHPVAFDRVRFDVDRDGVAARPTLAEATVEEITAATKARLRRSQKTPPGTHAVVRALTKLFAAYPELKHLTVHRTADHTTIGHIGDAVWPALRKAIAKFEAPAG